MIFSITPNTPAIASITSETFFSFASYSAS